MSIDYQETLARADKLIDLLIEAESSVTDPLAKRQYIGFLSVTAVTFYEEAFKEILISFAMKKHKVFGTHISYQYNKMNGQITLNDFKNRHIPRFGEKYKKRLTKKLDKCEFDSLKSGEGSIKSSYGNIVTWRNNFVHGGEIPANASFSEAINSYNRGKIVIEVIAECLVR